MSDEYSPSVGIEDLLLEEEEVFVNKPVSLKTGTGVNIVESKPVNEGVKPNALRWLFNPFEFIDLTNEPASCGIFYLENVVFNQIKSIDINLSNGSPFELASSNQYDPQNLTHNPDAYRVARRTALMITDELLGKHGDKGVIGITGLLEQDTQTAGDLNTLLFGEEVACVVDINHPNHPCPVLPSLLESLDANMRTNLKRLDAETAAIVTSAAKQCRDAINLALRNCRTRIDTAQKRILDEKNPNRTLSYAEQRCYLALGEEIPNVMPFTTRSNSMGMNQPQGGALDSEALGRGIAAGLRDAGISPTPSVVEQAKTVVSTNGNDKAPDFSVSEEDIADIDTLDEDENQATDMKTCAALTGKGEPCKNNAEEGSDYCKVPAHQASASV